MALKSVLLKHPEIASINLNSVTLQNSQDFLTWTPSSELITSFSKFKDFWVFSTNDKSIRFFNVSWANKAAEEIFNVKHKKQVSNMCSNSKFLFFADKTGEVWRLNHENLASGISENLANCDLFVGHQASIDILWCDEEHLITVDQEFKIKVTQIAQGLIEDIFLGHTCKIISAIKYANQIISCDEQGNLIFWSSVSAFQSLRLNESITLHPFHDNLLGVSQSNTYLVDLKLQQVVPILASPALVDYPHAFISNSGQFQVTKLNFNLD